MRLFELGVTGPHLLRRGAEFVHEAHDHVLAEDEEALLEKRTGRLWHQLAIADLGKRPGDLNDQIAGLRDRPVRIGSDGADSGAAFACGFHHRQGRPRHCRATAGDEQIVAIAQYFLDPKTQAAEVAFLVQDEWQQKGMGTFLLDYITQIAKKRGVKKFYAKVLSANKPMLAIFYNSGYTVNTEFDGDVYSISYDLVKPEKEQP